MAQSSTVHDLADFRSPPLNTDLLYLEDQAGTAPYKVRVSDLLSLVPTPDILPPQAGNAGKFLSTDGAGLVWDTPPAGGGVSLPSQAGNAGKFLTTDGTVAAWAAVNLAGYAVKAGGNAFTGTQAVAGSVQATGVGSAFDDLISASTAAAVKSWYVDYTGKTYATDLRFTFDANSRWNTGGLRLGSVLATNPATGVLSLGNTTASGLGGVKVVSVTNDNPTTNTALLLSGTAGVKVAGGSAGVTPLVVGGFAGQTSDLQQWQDSTGTVLSAVAPSGRFRASSGLHVTGGSFPSTGAGLEILYGGGNAYIQCYNRDAGAFETLNISAATVNLSGSVVMSGVVGMAAIRLLGQTGPLVLGDGVFYYRSDEGFFYGTGGGVQQRLNGDRVAQSSTGAQRNQSAAVGSWVDNTDASRKARITWNVYDTAAREYLRAEGDGAAARIGFLGAATVVRQTLPGAGVVTADDLRTALINLGLCG